MSETGNSQPKPILSVIIPVRNHARVLRLLLDNLKKQKVPPGWTVEVLISENGSTDQTLEVIRASGFRSINPAGHGAGPARNAGVRASGGELILFIDADACPVNDDHLIRVVQLAKQFGQFGVFGGAILLPKRQWWNPVAIGDHWACWFNWHPKRDPQRTDLFQPAVSFVVRRSVFQSLGGFKENAMILEDMEFQHRLLRAGLPVYFFPRLQVTHEARGSLLRSWQHSWSWGGAFRERFLTDVQGYGLKYPVGDPKFARNFGYIFYRRLRFVAWAAWRNSRWQAIVGAPFYTLTILSWAIAVIWGHEPLPEEMRTI
jgi:GT2 family glycosyltransferase